MCRKIWHAAFSRGKYRNCSANVKAPRQETPTFSGTLDLTAQGTAKQSFADGSHVWFPPALELKAQQQGSPARDDGGGETRTTARGHPATGFCSQDVVAWRQEALGLVGNTPVAERQRFALGIH